jgi:hypothetical protein
MTSGGLGERNSIVEIAIRGNDEIHSVHKMRALSPSVTKEPKQKSEIALSHRNPIRGLSHGKNTR